MDINQEIHSLITSQGAAKTAIKQVETMAPLTLAYLGDAIFELFVRDYLIRQSQTSTHRIHQQAITYVNAGAQSMMVHRLMPFLTEKEADVVRRGRNVKNGSVPRNADVVAYRYATGFEALLGWLYCQRYTLRLLEVMEKAITLLETARMEENKANEAI